MVVRQSGDHSRALVLSPLPIEPRSDSDRQLSESHRKNEETLEFRVPTLRYLLLVYKKCFPA